VFVGSQNNPSGSIYATPEYRVELSAIDQFNERLTDAKDGFDS
jgi:hypothetical protein